MGRVEPHVPAGNGGKNQASAAAVAPQDARATKLDKGEVLASDGRVIRLQNRDRGGDGSVQQMNEIAANPKFHRVSISNNFTGGAPVVFGNADALPKGAVTGRNEVLFDGKDDEYDARYAVVEAGDIIPSHNADGGLNANYAAGEAGKLRAVAGNGRAAALNAAWERGTMGAYRDALLRQARSFGLDADAVSKMKRPVLVRVMREGDLKPDMGDRTNTTETAQLSPQEQAANDAQRIDLTDEHNVAIDDNGQPTRDSLMRFINATPAAERAGMLDARTGEPTRQAVDRFMAAIFKQAYQSDELVRLYAQATDPEARNVLSALANAAPLVAQLTGKGQYDLRAAYAGMAEDVVNAVRRGEKLSTWLKQDDFARSEEARILLDAIADDIRAPKRMSETLKSLAQLAKRQADAAEIGDVQGGFEGFGSATLPRSEVFKLLAERTAEIREARANGVKDAEPALFSRTPVAEAAADTAEAMFSRANRKKWRPTSSLAQSDEESARILQGASVASVRVEDAPRGNTDVELATAAAEIFKQQGGFAERAGIGDDGKITLDYSSAISSIKHGGANDYKRAAFPVVKDVIERGAIVLHARHGNMESYYISAPVDIDGERCIVTAHVRHDANMKRMYLHGVTAEKNLLTPSEYGAVAEDEPTGAKGAGGSANIPEGIHAGKASRAEVAQRLHELLTMDAEGEGASFARNAPSTARKTASNARRVPVLTDAQVQQRDTVREMAAGIARAWKNAPRVHVVHDIRALEVPRAIRDADEAMRRQGAQGEPEAVYYNGEVYIFAGKTNTKEAVTRVVAHEVLAHHGLRGAFGDALKTVLADIDFVRRKQMVDLARRYGLFDAAKLPAGVTPATASNGDILRAMSAQQRRMAAEEVLAHMAETQPTLGFVRRAVAAIRTWLRQNVPGFGKVPVSDDEIIRSFILPAREWVQSGSARGEVTSPLTPLFRRAWHGTPYGGIEKEGFKLHAIGSGEGAQAYGWGMYFAGARGVAEEYRRVLSKRKLRQRQTNVHQGKDGAAGQLYQVEVPEDDELLHWDRQLHKQRGSVLGAIEKLFAARKDVRDAFADKYISESDFVWEKLDDLITKRIEEDVYEKTTIERKTATAEDGETFEYYEAFSPYSGEPTIFVSEENEDYALEKFGRDNFETGDITTQKEAADFFYQQIEGEYAATIADNYSFEDFEFEEFFPDGLPAEEIVGGLAGEDFYRQLSDMLGSPRAASEALLAAGIPGLRYLDGMSRTKGEGTHNYVIWDEALLTPEAAQITPLFSRGKVASSDGKVASSLQPSGRQAQPMKPEQVRELGNRMREQAQRKLNHLDEAEVNALARQLLGWDARANKQENIPALLELLKHDMTLLHDALGLEVSEPTRRAAEQQRNPQWQEEQQRGRKLDFGGRSVDELAQEYAAMEGTDGGRLIDVDKIRELSPEYRADRSRASDIHEEASALSQQLYERALAQPVREGRNARVVFTAGGGGVGKSSAIDRLFKSDDADITLDGTFSNLAKARARVQAALASGRQVQIRYVYRSPENAAQGAIQRAISSGRPVPTSALAKAHAQSLQTVRAIAEEFKNDGRVSIIAIDNNGNSLDDVHVADISQIPEVNYDDAKRTFDAAVDAEWEAAHGDGIQQDRGEDAQQAGIDAPREGSTRGAAQLGRAALRGSTQGGRSPSGGNAVITSDAKRTFDAAVDAEWEAAHGGRIQQADSEVAQRGSPDATRDGTSEGRRGLESTTVRGSAESGGARGHLTRAQYKAFTGREPPAGNGGGNGNGGGGEGSTGYAAPAMFKRTDRGSVADRAQAIINERVKSGRYFDRAMRALTRALGIEKLTRAIGGAAAKALHKFTPEAVKAGLVADYGLPQEAIDARVLMQGAKLQQLRKAGSFVEKLATMTNEEAQLAYDWMTNESYERVTEALATLPDEKIAVLLQVRDMIDALGQEAVRLGLLSNEAYQRNKGAYLHRSYAKHVLGDVTGKGKRRGKGGGSTAILGTNLHRRGIDETARMEQVRVGGETWWDVSRRSGRADENFIGRRLRRLERRADAGEGTEALPGMEGKRAGRVREVVYVPAGDDVPAQYKGWHDAGVWEVRDVAGDKLQIWRDYTAQERAEMGEIKDVRYAIMSTLQGMIGDVETARYLRWLSREYGKAPGEEVTGEIVDASEGYLRPFLPNEWVKVPETNADGTKAKRYGALAGKYVPGPVFNDIRHMLRNGRWLDGLAGDAFHTIMQAWKTSKTSLSPTVHVNNIMSNFVMADWADVSVGHLTKAMRIVMGAHDLQGAGVLGNAGNLAARATGMADREAAREIVQRYKDSGGELGSWTVTETMRSQMEPWLEKLEAQAAHDHADMGAQIGVMAALQRMAHGDFKGGAKAAAGAAMRAVGREGKTMIDLYGNEDAVFRLAVWLKAKEDGASDIEAGRMARRALLDYNINAPWIQLAKSTALPFISFSYRGFPLLARTLTEKPHKMMKFVLFATALNQLGLMLAGADDDDEVRRLLPDEKAGRVWGMVPKLIRMPWNDKNDSPVYLDIRRWIPMGDVFDVGQGHAALPLPPALMPAGPLAVLKELLSNKSDFTGKEITLETDTTREKAGKVAEHLYKSFVPNVPLPPVPGLEALDTWSTTNIRRALRGETDVFGREQSVGMAAAGSVGVKLGAYPPDVLRRNVAFNLRRQEQEIGKNISAIKRQLALGRITQEEAQKKAAAQNAKKMKLREEYARKLGAGERSFLERIME